MRRAKINADEIPEDVEKQIIKDYNTGLGVTKLRKKYGFPDTSIYYLLGKNKLEIRYNTKNGGVFNSMNWGDERFVSKSFYNLLPNVVKQLFNNSIDGLKLKYERDFHGRVIVSIWRD